MKSKSILFMIIFIIALLASFVALATVVTYKNEQSVYTLSGAAKQSLSVVLDAGHGDFDSGAIGVDGTLEKDINLQIALKTENLLKLNGIKVIMIRDTDSALNDDETAAIRQKKIQDTHNRMNIINKNSDAIFVSIHQNKYPLSSITGTQVFYSKNNPKSSELAQSVQSSVAANMQKNNTRHIKPSGTEIYLLYYSQTPSILVECGFVSNSNELKKLKSDGYQKKMAVCIVNGILNYFYEQGVL